MVKNVTHYTQIEYIHEHTHVVSLTHTEDMCAHTYKHSNTLADQTHTRCIKHTYPQIDTHTQTHTHTHTHTHTQELKHPRMHTYTHIQAHINKHKHTHTHTHTYACAIDTHTNTQEHKRPRMHTHTQTHRHTDTQT